MGIPRAIQWISGNRYLTKAEMEQNAQIIYVVLRAKGWSMEAISAVLANMQYESTINPGIWESFEYGNTSAGYGLIQWTPATKYINWAGEHWETNHTLQLERLHYESTCGGAYWIYRNEYPGWTYEGFRTSTESPFLLACVFAWYAEGSKVVQSGTDEEKELLRQQRGQAAISWYEFLKDKTEVQTTRRRLPIWMMVKPPHLRRR